MAPKNLATNLGGFTPGAGYIPGSMWQNGQFYTPTAYDETKDTAPVSSAPSNVESTPASVPTVQGIEVKAPTSNADKMKAILEDRKSTRLNSSHRT